MNLNNKVVVITGAGSGLGRALALKAANEGAHIVCVGRRFEKLEETLNQCSGRAKHIAVKCDITSHDDRQNLINTVIARYQRIDVLINNAAVVMGGSIADIPEKDIAHVIQTDLTAPLILTKLVLPYMEGTEKKHIVNIGSMASYWAMPYHGLYNSVKFGIAGFTRSLIEQYKGTNTGVTIVYPGSMSTEMISKKIESESEKMGWKSSSPINSAAKIIKGIKRGRSVVYAQTVSERIMGNLFTKHILFKSLMRKKLSENFRQAAPISNEHTQKALYRE